MALIQVNKAGAALDLSNLFDVAAGASQNADRTSSTVTITPSSNSEYVAILCAASYEYTYSLTAQTDVTNISGDLSTNCYGGVIVVRIDNNSGTPVTLTITHPNSNPRIVACKMNV